MWIFTETWKKHLKSIQATLDRLRAVKLTAKSSKCKIGYSRFSVIALNHDVSGRSHFTEIISHSFSILLSVELASILCTGSIGRYQ